MAEDPALHVDHDVDPPVDDDAHHAGFDGVFDDVLTWPNLFTLVRLLCLPLFLYLLFPADNPAGASWLLVALGSTDWVDGWLARKLDQTSEFGKVFDPTVDRLLFLVSVTAIVIDGRIPLWFAIAVLAREIFVAVMMTVATVFFHMERFDVTWLGKTATFLLMGAVPSFLNGSAGVWESDFFQVVAWAIGIPGLVLSWYTAIAYIPQVRAGLRAGRAGRDAEPAITSTST